MFDRCARWSVLLSRRADSVLSSKDWGELQNHIAGCARCRQLVEADDALHDVLGIYTPQFSADAALDFDDNVVSALASSPSRIPRFSLLAECRRKVCNYWRSLPLDLFSQVGGGAAFAMCLTSFFLIPALHSNSAAHSAHTANQLAERTSASDRAVLPVSIESLLNVPSPRAAMLWTAPEERKPYHSSAGLPVSDPAVLPSYPNASDPDSSTRRAFSVKPVRPEPKAIKKETLKHSSILINEVMG